MDRYYKEKLAARRLQRCYEVAPPRVRQYLRAEIEYVLSRIRPLDIVLELGCGYGRVMAALAPYAKWVVGIDSAWDSLALGVEYLQSLPNCRLIQMDAVATAFRDGAFDAILCIQNGLSAFKVSQSQLVKESVRITKPGGTALFSSYAEKFWPHRLEWFRLQAAEGLLGEIDEEATGNGVIVCKDGFRATTIGPDDFASLMSDLDLNYRIAEVDESSLFCEIAV